MSIAPLSDIILDVAQAADPVQRQAAVDKLARAAAQAGVPTGNFESALGAAGSSQAPRVALRDPSLAVSPLEGAGRSQVTAGRGSPYQRFEAMMLQQFVETILPKDAELFGDATSSDMARSLMAEKIAEQLARSGRIGIARTLEAHAALVGGAAPPAPAGLAATTARVPTLLTMKAARG